MTAATSLSMSTVLVLGLCLVALGESAGSHGSGPGLNVADEVAASMATICPDARVTFAGYMLDVGDALARFDRSAAELAGQCR